MRKLSVCIVLAVAAVAHGGVDTTGWTLLGSQKAKGRDKDRDTIVVGKYDGKFDEIQLVVTDADLNLKAMTVVFTNGQTWSPPVAHSFKEGQRSRAIDLPGADRAIAKIDFVYSAPHGGTASVAVYGRDKKGAGGSRAPAPAPAPAFNKQGWTKLGAGVVNGKRDRDVIRVGLRKGGFDQLTMVVDDSDLQLEDMDIVFTNGQKWSPKLKHTFKEGQRSRAIDLPGKDRTIARIEVAYANLPGGGNAKVELYARDVGRPAPPPLSPVKWEKKGWTFLGKATVDGWKDKDRVAVRKGKPFSELMFVVTGSDVKLDKVTVTLGNNERFETQSGHTFKEGARIAPIDVPGKLRRIRTIDFAYTNLPGGGRASVEVWGRVKS